MTLNFGENSCGTTLFFPSLGLYYVQDNMYNTGIKTFSQNSVSVLQLLIMSLILGKKSKNVTKRCKNVLLIIVHAVIKKKVLSFEHSQNLLKVKKEL